MHLLLLIIYCSKCAKVKHPSICSIWLDVLVSYHHGSISCTFQSFWQLPNIERQTFLIWSELVSLLIWRHINLFSLFVFLVLLSVLIWGILFNSYDFQLIPRLCLVPKFLSLNFTIHLSHQIFYLMHGALNVDKKTNCIVLMYTTRRIFWA